MSVKCEIGEIKSKKQKSLLFDVTILLNGLLKYALNMS